MLSAAGRAQRRASSRPRGAFAKGGRRDLGQALANGGVAAALAVAAAAAPAGLAGRAVRRLCRHAWPPSPPTPGPPNWACSAAPAPPGHHRARGPRGHLRRGQRPGLAGRRAGRGSHRPGRAGACAGLWPRPAPALAAGAWLAGRRRWLGGLPGRAGRLAAGRDRAAGLLVPATAGKETERRVHSCGTPTRPLRGRPWADNEVVNLACALAGAGLGLLVALLWRG